MFHSSFLVFLSPITTIFQGSGSSVNFFIESVGGLIVVTTTHFSELILFSVLLK